MLDALDVSTAVSREKAQELAESRQSYECTREERGFDADVGGSARPALPGRKRGPMRPKPRCWPSVQAESMGDTETAAASS